MTLCNQPDGSGEALPRQPRTAYAAGMRAVQFDMVDPAFPASLADIPEPDLPGPAWARVAVTTGGICGSDLHLFAHNTGPSPTL